MMRERSNLVLIVERMVNTISGGGHFEMLNIPVFIIYT